MGPAISSAQMALGHQPMQWQELVSNIGGEVDEEDAPAFREVIASTPRQSGKTSHELAVAEQRAVGWRDILGEPQKMLYTAQTGIDARKKLLNDWYPILWPRRRELGISVVTKANGNESILWANGSRLDLMGSGEDAGHGKTVDAAFKDELFADSDNRRDQALIPAMATRPFGQMWTYSTMGTPASVAWNAKVALGRAAAEAGRTDGIAYIEYSADPDADPADPATWYSCMPALGYTQTEESIRHAFDSMALGEFRRAFLNIPTGAAEQVLPAVDWDLVNSPDAAVPYEEARAVSVDCNPERTWSGICVAGAGTVEVIDRQAGTGWVIAKAREIHQTRRLPFIVDKTGPAATFVPALEEAGITVVELGARDVAAAAGKFYDDIVNHTIKIRRDPDLDAAVAAANRRPAGDAWAWGRKNSTADISLLVAATNAHWHAERAAAPSQYEERGLLVL